MKITTLTALVLILTLSATGQNVSHVPSLCTPCIFYGGDYDQYDQNSNAFTDGNTLSVPNTEIYTAVDIPKEANGVITGILFMQLTVGDGDYFDPATAPYDIRIGLSEGNGGTSVASGANTLAYKIYQEVDVEFYIYQTAVNLTTPFRVTPGTRYWFTVVPQCTDTGNPDCNGPLFHLPNTTEESNGLNAAAQPPNQMFWNSAFFGFNWENVCD